MTEIATMAAETRQRAGKGAARAARREGRVPAVVYGDKKDPVMVNLDRRLLMRELNRPGFFAKQYDLQVDGQTHRVLARDVQVHPVTEIPLHVDFLRVSESTRVTVDTPVIFHNEEESPGLKRGGVLNVVRHEIELECAVAAIPQSIDIDLTGLDIGDSVHISQVKLPQGVKPTITDRDFTIATIAAPTVVTEEEEEAAAAEEEEEGAEAEAPAEGEAPEKEEEPEGEKKESEE